MQSKIAYCGESRIRSGMLVLKIYQNQLLLLRKMFPLKVW